MLLCCSNMLFIRIIKPIFLIILFLISPLGLCGKNGIVKYENGNIELRNNNASIIISNKAELESFVSLHKRFDIAAKNRNKIARIKTSDGVIIEADKVEIDGDCIIVNIGEYKLSLKVQVYSDFFTFEVRNKSLPGVDVLTFIDFNLDYSNNKTNSFCATGVAMSMQTNPVYFPSCENSEIVGCCISHTGIYGAKLAVVAGTKDNLWEIVKSVYHSLSPHSLPIVYASGGPFAADSKANRYDCAIMGDPDISPDKVTEWIDFYSRIGVQQLDFLLDQTTFIQGDFSFPAYGSAKSFKEQITDPLYEEGIISTLHSYSYYISPLSEEILSDPKWQRQLEFRGEFTLSKDISPQVINIDVTGDLKLLKDVGAYSSVITPYMLIDNEIIEYKVNNGILENCKRGQCGTKASFHKKGSKIQIIGGQFNYIAPIIGSDLFYEIARRTAIAYNEGGFRGFYFDAIDGLYVHLNHLNLNKCLWYYESSFINEVLKYCEKEPLVVELSRLSPTLWPSRGRGECWDTPNRGYKNFIDEHTARNSYLLNRQYVATLGWFDFYPIRTNQPGNFMTKYMYFDDVDYLGVKAIAYNQTMVYNGLLKKTVEDIPALRRNLEIYSLYNKMRTENYFTEKVKEKLRTGDFEYKLSKRRGVWGFNEVKYCRSKLRNIRIDHLDGINPYKGQKPFIRFENLYSSDCSSQINLLRIDDSTVFSDLGVEKKFEKPLNLEEHLALKITLCGNGNDSKDALCIRLRSSELSGYADYIVFLNFEGWRDVIVTNLDNAEYPYLSFSGLEDECYQMHRFNIDYSNINYINVCSSNNCKSVKVSSIDAVPITSNPIINPAIHINNTSTVFIDTIQSGEYIEYNVGDDEARVYDCLGNSRSIEVKLDRNFKVPKGRFVATITGMPQNKDIPNAVDLTFGFFGKFIHN